MKLKGLNSRAQSSRSPSRYPSPSRSTRGDAPASAPSKGKGQSKTVASGQIPRGKAGYDAARLAGLRRGNPGERIKATAVPQLDDAMAVQFVRLTMAGFSPLAALRYCDAWTFTHSTKVLRQEWLNAWTGDDRVTAELDRVNGGKWHDLDPKERLQLAIDKHHAELAFFLFTHNFNTLYGPDLEKAKEARDVLTHALEGSDSASRNTPYMKAILDIVSGAITMPRYDGQEDANGTRPN